MSVETEGLERALDALLTAMVNDEAQRPKPPMDGISAKVLDLKGPVPTRSEIEVTQLLREPVYAACRIAVRRLGEQAFIVTGGTDGMRDVAERVADRIPALYGRRLSIMDGAWDGVGSDADRWWA